MLASARSALSDQESSADDSEESEIPASVASTSMQGRSDQRLTKLVKVCNTEELLGSIRCSNYY